MFALIRAIFAFIAFLGIAFHSVLAHSTTIQSGKSDSKTQIKIILALVASAFIIVTIVVIIVIVLLSISGKNHKKHDKTLNRRTKHKSPFKDSSNDSDTNVFAARGQSDDPKKPPEGSGSFVFSGYTMDKTIPRDDSYAASLKNTDASDSFIHKQKPTDLVIKDNTSAAKSIEVKPKN